MLIEYIGGAAVTGAFTIGAMFLNRRWAQKDKREDRQSSILSGIDALAKKLDRHISEDEKYKANQARTRILRFSDELRRGILHSEESFNNVLEDIDAYCQYCNEHEDTYVNSKAEAAIKNIKLVHDECLSGKLKFL